MTISIIKGAISKKTGKPRFTKPKAAEYCLDSGTKASTLIWSRTVASIGYDSTLMTEKEARAQLKADWIEWIEKEIADHQKRIDEYLKIKGALS